MRTQSKFNVMLLLLLAGLFSGQVMSQEDPLLAETDEVLNSEQIDVDGLYNRRPKKTKADRIAEMRKKLEEQNEQMVQKKIEDIRIQEEQKLTNRLQNAFGGMNAALNDQVEVKQAAPQKVVIEEVEVKEEAPKGKVIPSLGVLNISNENFSWESKVAFGLAAESMITERFSAGVGVSYATLEAKDCDSNYTYCGTGYVPGSVYGNYANQYPEGREIEYKHLIIEVNGKFFITTTSMIRPYVGLSLSYNRVSMEYSQESARTPGYWYDPYTNSQFGDETYNSSYGAGAVVAGVEVKFSKNVGLDLNVKLQRPFGSFNEESSASSSSSANYDLRRLENIGETIQDSTFVGINGGLVVAF